MANEFTLTDKALMLRAARFMVEEAAVLAQSHGPVWAATADGVVAKRQHDRLLRDARDLRALVKRFVELHPPVAVPAACAGKDYGHDWVPSPDHLTEHCIECQASRPYRPTESGGNG